MCGRRTIIPPKTAKHPRCDQSPTEGLSFALERRFRPALSCVLMPMHSNYVTRLRL